MMLNAVSEPIKTNDRITVNVKVATMAFVGMLVRGETCEDLVSGGLTPFCL